MLLSMSPEEARAALARAAESSRRVRSRAPSLRIYCWVSAAGLAASLLAFGLIEPLSVRLPVWLALIAFPLAAVVGWYRRRPATAVRMPPPRGGWLAFTVPTAILYAVAASVGEVASLYGDVRYWVPAALTVAAPLAVLALRTPRP
jgi:hypothetical protein